MEFCEAAAVTLESGGRFVGITTLYSDFIAGRATDPKQGKIETEPLTRSLHWEGSPRDGMLATVSIFTEDRKTRATFPNYLWSKHSISRALEAAGFVSVSWHPLAADGAPETGATTTSWACSRRASLELLSSPLSPTPRVSPRLASP